MDIKEHEAFESVFTAENGWDLTCINGCYQNIGTFKAFAGWKAAKEHATPEGFVLVPKECPDPIFADKLFDHLCKKAHGEFGDDQMIFFSDIDESAIWQLMIEAQELNRE